MRLQLVRSLSDFFAKPGTGIFRTLSSDEDWHVATISVFCAAKFIGFQMSDDKNTKNFEIQLDVSSFHADDLRVYVRDRELVVSGCHDERQEGGGLVERRFVRKYILPRSALDEEMTSELGADGVLKVVVPTNEPVECRKIPIKVDPNWKMHSNPCQELILREPIPLWWW